MEFVVNPKTNRRVKKGSRKYVELMKEYQGRENELFNYKQEKKKYVKKADKEKEEKKEEQDTQDTEQSQEQKLTSSMSARISDTDFGTTTEDEDKKEEEDESIFIKNPRDNGDKLYNYINYLVMKKINEMLVSE